MFKIVIVILIYQRHKPIDVTTHANATSDIPTRAQTRRTITCAISRVNKTKIKLGPRDTNRPAVGVCAYSLRDILVILVSTLRSVEC
jgi:hypothetical protein